MVMTLIYPVILNEVKNPELFLPLLSGFFTSFRMTDRIELIEPTLTLEHAKKNADVFDFSYQQLATA
jgi:hypothetical protein